MRTGDIVAILSNGGFGGFMKSCRHDCASWRAKLLLSIRRGRRETDEAFSLEARLNAADHPNHSAPVGDRGALQRHHELHDLFCKS